MERVLELITDVRARYPRDQFFDYFEPSCAAHRLKRMYYAEYGRAFMTLDSDAWNSLKLKALNHYLDHRPGQLKQGFFNQLNEAFAYRFLKKRGLTQIRFVPESGQRTPGLAFVKDRQTCHCEVKTLCISQEVILRRSTSKVFDGSTYQTLNTNFFTKLSSDIDDASSQLSSQSGKGLAYIFVIPDDFTLEHYATYRRQLTNFVQRHSASDLYLKVGILGQRAVSKGTIARSNSVPNNSFKPKPLRGSA